MQDIVVSRYAEAFTGYAKASMGLEKALIELQVLRRLIHDNPEMMIFLKAEGVTHTEKISFIDRILNQSLSTSITNLLKLLLDKERIGLLSGILEYIRVHYAHEGEEDVLLKTTFPLDLEVIQDIEQKLEKKFNKKLRFYIDLDASLLGGIQVVMGHTVIDGSVRKKLNDLKYKLKQAKVAV